MESSFHFADYVVFALILLLSTGIGIFTTVMSKAKKNTEEYMMASRDLRLFPVALSICVSLVSASAILGIPAELYQSGLSMTMFFLTMTIGSIVLALTVIPVIYPLKIVSVHEYLGKRFKSHTVKLYGTWILIAQQLLYVGIVLYGPALSLEVATGIPTLFSLIITAAVGILYTTIGGMRGAVWASTFQAAIMLIGCVVVIIYGSVEVGSFKEVVDINMKWDRLDMDFSVDPRKKQSVLTSGFGGIFFIMAMYGANQPCLQRTNTLPNVTLAKWSVVVAGVFISLIGLLCTAVGMVIFAYYTKLGCDPIKSGVIKSANQILPYFIMDVLDYPGLPGLLFGSFFCAALSSLSSSINSMSTVLWTDVLHAYFSTWNEERKTFWNKILTLIFGVSCFGCSLLMNYIGGSLVAISTAIVGAFMGPLLGVILLAMFVPFANWKGALCGGLLSISVLTWMVFGAFEANTQKFVLPVPTDGCPIDNNITSSGNISFNALFNNITSNTSSSSENMISPDNVNNIISDYSQSPSRGGSEILADFYAISSFLYPLIGVLISLIAGTVISLVTCFGKEANVLNKYLFSVCRKGVDDKIVDEVNDLNKVYIIIRKKF